MQYFLGIQVQRNRVGKRVTIQQNNMTKALARDRHHLLISRMGVSATSVSTTPSLSRQITDLGEDGELDGSEEVLRHREIAKKWE
jgi:hypothetical protein